jgi:glucosamine--fructose-6-phosphate aminotransferase (isomerizing)
VSALEDTIRSQPELLEQMLQRDLGPLPDSLGGARRIWLVGTGTSQHAAELGAWLLQGAGREARPVSSATFVRWSESPGAEDVVIVISHTGGSTFAQAARERALASGARLLAITGQGAGWENAIETVPHERSETYTASYTTVLLLLARAAAALGFRELEADLSEVPDRTREAVADPAVDGVQAPARLLAVAGPGPFAITAREGALKLREAARLLAEGFESEYLLHGNAVPLNGDDLLMVLQPDADEDGLSAGVGEAARAAGVPATVLAEPPGLHPLLAQIPLTVRLQRLASRLADERGQDPDKVITGPWDDDGLWALGRP